MASLDEKWNTNHCNVKYLLKYLRMFFLLTIWGDYANYCNIISVLIYMLGMKPFYTVICVILCHFLQSMLVKVKLGDAQKFVKITELSLEEFLSAGKNILSLYYFRRFYVFFFLIYVLLDGCLVILYENILYSHMLHVPWCSKFIIAM